MSFKKSSILFYNNTLYFTWGLLVSLAFKIGIWTLNRDVPFRKVLELCKQNKTKNSHTFIACFLKDYISVNQVSATKVFMHCNINTTPNGASLMTLYFGVLKFLCRPMAMYTKCNHNFTRRLTSYCFYIEAADWIQSTVVQFLTSLAAFSSTELSLTLQTFFFLLSRRS